MDFRDVLKARHSVRAYSRKEIEPEKMRRVLEAANSAPSAGNLQAYEIFVVRDAEKRKALADASFGQEFVAEAPAVLVFCASPKRARKYGKRGELYAVQDATIAAAFAWLAAVDEGLSACWVGAFDSENVLKTLSAQSALSNKLEPVAILPVGHADEKPEPTERRKLSELVHEV